MKISGVSDINVFLGELEKMICSGWKNDYINT
jgi:hypothetical protein